MNESCSPGPSSPNPLTRFHLSRRPLRHLSSPLFAAGGSVFAPLLLVHVSSEISRQAKLEESMQNGTIMPHDVRIDVNSNQQQHSSPLIQNNNGNDRSLMSTGVGAQEKSTPIADLLENTVARRLGLVACGWVLVVLVEGGLVGTLETMDCGFVTLLFFLVFFRCWRHYYPEAYRSFIEAIQSLSADHLGIPNDIEQLAQQLALPSRYIRRLFHYSSLVSAMTSIVLSLLRLASQDFGKKEVDNKESRDFALKVFYGLTLAEALVLLCALTLPFPKKRNSVGLVDRPGDGPDDGPGNGPGDRPEDSPGDGPEDISGDGPEDRPADGPENGPGGEPEDGSENGPGGESGDGPGDGSVDGPVNQCNECNAVAQMDRPANQSNDFKLAGPADSLPNLRQRRREIPKSGDGDSTNVEEAASSFIQRMWEIIEKADRDAVSALSNLF